MGAASRKPDSQDPPALVAFTNEVIDVRLRDCHKSRPTIDYSPSGRHPHPILKQHLQIFLQNLPIRVAGQRFLYEADRDRRFEDRQAGLHPGLQLGLGRFHARGEVDDGGGFFA